MTVGNDTGFSFLRPPGWHDTIPIMELIFTHDNADFDAVASQLAAHKLMPEAQPVLSRRLNINVRHFLSLYWDELPYIRLDDVPREPVSRVIVVDSQHFPTVRGVDEATQIQIIDHHAPRDNLKPEWQLTTDSVGAATTILCERLQSHNIALSPIEATLLMLGIYEDTGSLSYRATTGRDIFAAAWLKTQGARLDVLREFLHYPLSDDQRALFDKLLEQAETFHIEGHPIVVCASEAYELKESLAVLAQKLRDTFDPAAIFVLADLGSHVQLVARSTVDEIDVGRVAGEFGGGGHIYASAAIIRDQPLGEAKQNLLDILPDLIEPGVVVSDLMSRGVQTLAPDTRADDAIKLMRRRGHEGFPIVDDGQVVGLLTRNAVDRALDHGLVGVKARQLMDAGEIIVSPGDSINKLQQIMMTSGWGQIPVVGDDGTILGVVTRTDLINHLGHAYPSDANQVSRRAAIIQRLENALPPILLALVREIGRIAEDMDLNLYVVGGFVRDLLLGTPTLDIDFVVEGDAVALTRALRRKFGGEMRSHARFGTGKWMIDLTTWEKISDRLNTMIDSSGYLPPHIDFVSARAEFYEAPTVLPTVETGNIKLDLHRRDFTINTLAIRLDPHRFGQLLDFYEGERDLHAGVIRVLHSLSFVDDPTRILRAVRLEQRLKFRIEARTQELIADAVPLLDRVSGDRIRHEIELILIEQKPENAFRRLDVLGVLGTIHPSLHWDEWMAGAFARLRSGLADPVWPELAAIDSELPYFALLTYRLPVNTLDVICKRIRVKRRTVEVLHEIARIRKQIDVLELPQKPSQIDAVLHKASENVLITLWAADPNDMARNQIADYARRLRHISAVTDGAVLKQMGFAPGPMFGRVLKRLRVAWLDGEISTSEQEQTLLRHLLDQEMA